MAVVSLYLMGGGGGGFYVYICCCFLFYFYFISSFFILFFLPRCREVKFNVALRPHRLYGLNRTERPGRPPRLSHSSHNTKDLSYLPYDQNVVKIVVCFLQPSSKQSKDGETTDRAHSKNKGKHHFTDFID